MIIFQAQTRSLTLRSPKLGNTFQGNTFTQIKRAMSGKYYAYKQTPTAWVLKWDFDYIDRTKVLETIIFLRNTAAQMMQVTTHDNEIWVGKIINRFEMASVKVSDNAFTIFFEGVKQ